MNEREKERERQKYFSSDAIENEILPKFKNEKPHLLLNLK